MQLHTTWSQNMSQHVLTCEIKSCVRPDMTNVLMTH